MKFSTSSLFNGTPGLQNTWEMFCHSSPQACDIKDIKTKQYAIVSWPFAESVGLTREAMIGLTAQDIRAHQAHLNTTLNNKWLQNIQALDQKVITLKKACQLPYEIYLDYTGVIRISTLVKSPLFNIQRKIIGIISYAHNITDQYDLWYLWSLYCKYYTETDSVLYFLNY